jgi:hypothetical protein
MLRVEWLVNVEDLQSEAQKMHRHFLRGQRLWSAAYHGSSLGAAGLALLATVLAASNAGNGAIAWATGGATALSAITASGRPGPKWRSARLCRGRMEDVLSDLRADSPDLEKIRRAMKSINRRHDAEVVDGVDNDAPRDDDRG